MSNIREKILSVLPEAVIEDGDIMRVTVPDAKWHDFAKTLRDDSDLAFASACPDVRNADDELAEQHRGLRPGQPPDLAQAFAVEMREVNKTPRHQIAPSPARPAETSA